MARRNLTLEEKERKLMIREFLKSNPVKDGNDLMTLMADLKKVYAAPDLEKALSELNSSNWNKLSTYFKYPEEVKTLIYTTNTIEGFNRQLRKVTKNKAVFPTDDNLFKMLYLAMIDITKKWTGRRKDWGQIYSQLQIFFANRLPD